jgi:hypothetical protein
MPWASFETELRHHPKLMAIPDKDRPAALALYVATVLHCAEMLTDGYVSAAVLVLTGEEIGLISAAKKRPMPLILADKLVDAGLFERHGRGFFVHDYRQYQPTRQDVFERRKSDAERKRRSRGQMKLEPVTEEVTPGRNNDVTADEQRDSRAHARTRTDADVEDKPRPLDVRGEGEGTASDFKIPDILVKDIAG